MSQSSTDLSQDCIPPAKPNKEENPLKYKICMISSCKQILKTDH